MQGPAAAKWIKTKFNPQTVCVIKDDSDYGIGLATAVTQALGPAAAACQGNVKTDQKEFSATVGQVQQANPQVIFYAGYYNEAAPLVQQLRDAGVQATFVAPDGVKDPRVRQATPGGAANGAYLTCPCVPQEGFTAFTQAYQQAYGDPAADLLGRGVRLRDDPAQRDRQGPELASGAAELRQDLQRSGPDEEVRVAARRRAHRHARLRVPRGRDQHRDGLADQLISDTTAAPGSDPGAAVVRSPRGVLADERLRPVFRHPAGRPHPVASREIVIHTVIAVADLVTQDSGPWINFDVGLFFDRFWANTINGLAYGSIYALVALGYTLVYGVLQLINFAHSEIFVIGVFGVYFTFLGARLRAGHASRTSRSAGSSPTSSWRAPSA